MAAGPSPVKLHICHRTVSDISHYQPHSWLEPLTNVVFVAARRGAARRSPDQLNKRRIVSVSLAIIKATHDRCHYRMSLSEAVATRPSPDQLHHSPIRLGDLISFLTLSQVSCPVFASQCFRVSQFLSGVLSTLFIIFGSTIFRCLKVKYLLIALVRWPI